MAVGLSLLVHVIILGGMAYYRFQEMKSVPELEISSVITDEREQQEFSKELDIQTDPSPINNQMAGGTVSTSVGSQVKMKASAPKPKPDTPPDLKNLNPRFNTSQLLSLGDSQMAESMGELDIAGETGAVVDGYGGALSRLTEELLRLMRDDKLLVVWLFDESESMKDDQKEIANNFQKVYAELGVALDRQEQKKGKRGTRRKKKKEADYPLLTAVIGYGQSIHPLTKRPTADINIIRSAIGKIAVDKSGKEMMCTAILKSLKQYAPLIGSQKRKLVFVVVTDESGDDGDDVETAIDKARRLRAPVYVLGREAVFGYTHARIVWKDPQYGLTHWLKVNRGPETAFPECMQWDGLRDRYDVYQSGFGPYDQVRIAKETGGVFFLLPGKEKNFVGKGMNEKRKYDFLDMKEYQPLLLPRREYIEARNRSKSFRSKIWDVIVTLNPNSDNPLPRYDENLKIREYYYPGEPDKFAKEATKQVAKAARAMQLLNKAISIVDQAEKFRVKEDSQRWRAGYDLLRAQCFAYRIRLFQFLLAMDNQVNKNVKFTKPKNNVWNARRTSVLIKPDELQYRRLMSAFKLRMTREEYLKQMDEQMQEAKKRYRFVIANHPGTPWARRASSEMRQGFGMKFVEDYRNPRYGKLKIKLPSF